MTILTAGTCGYIITASGAAIPAAVGSFAGVLVTGAKLWIQTDPAKVALSTAVGTGISSGAIAGAITGKAFISAASGALAGGMSSAAVGSVFIGTLAAAGSIASSPIGMLTMGTSCDGNEVKFDCWKPVIRDTSEEPSSGMVLRDVLTHSNVAKVTVTDGSSLPKMVIENVWNEKFEIEYVMLKDSDELYCHANRIN